MKSFWVVGRNRRAFSFAADSESITFSVKMHSLTLTFGTLTSFLTCGVTVLGGRTGFSHPIHTRNLCNKLFILGNGNVAILGLKTVKQGAWRLHRD